MSNILCISLCSKSKSNYGFKMLVEDLYMSDRVEWFVSKCKESNVEGRILSGKYGLLKFNDMIDYYDKYLERKDIKDIVRVVKKELKKGNWDKVVYYGVWGRGRNYWDVIKKSCDSLGIKVVYRDVGEMFEY
jgi:hypothetical protein